MKKSVFITLAMIVTILASGVLVSLFLQQQNRLARLENTDFEKITHESIPAKTQLVDSNKMPTKVLSENSNDDVLMAKPEHQQQPSRVLEEAIDWLRQNGFDSPRVNDVLGTILFEDGGRLKYKELIAFINSGTVNDENIVKILDILGDGYDGNLNGKLSQARDEKDVAIQQAFMDQLHSPAGPESFYKALASLNILVDIGERYGLFEESMYRNGTLKPEFDTEMLTMSLDYSLGSTYRQMPEIMDRLFQLDIEQRRELVHMVSAVYQAQVIDNAGLVSGADELNRYVQESKPELDINDVSLNDQLEFVSWYSLKELSEGKVRDENNTIDWTNYLEQEGTPAEILAVFDYYEDPEQIHNRQVPSSVLTSSAVYERVQERLNRGVKDARTRNRLTRVLTIMNSYKEDS